MSGNIVNVPLPPGCSPDLFCARTASSLLPALREFSPQLIVISAGFDAHRADPLAQLRLATEDFGWITDRLLEVADAHAGGRLVSVLEGGYDVPALLMVGGDDPVGGPRSVHRLADAYRRRSGLTDVTTLVYPDARHEIFNETVQAQVRADLLAWLDARYPERSSTAR